MPFIFYVYKMKKIFRETIIIKYLLILLILTLASFTFNECYKSNNSFVKIIYNILGMILVYQAWDIFKIKAK